MTEYNLVPNSENSLSNGLKIDDIIESSTLNIWGVTHQWNITGSWITFNFSQTLPEWADIEAIVTVTLKQNDNIVTGDVLSMTEWLDLCSLINEGTCNYTKTNLIKNWTFDIWIITNWANKDFIESKVLAGTTNVALAEIEMEADLENMEVQSLKIAITGGDFSNTFSNIRIVNWTQWIATGWIATFDGTKTIIEFSDFTLEDWEDKISWLLMADINTYSTSWDATAINLGTFQAHIMSATIQGEQSNNIILANINDNTWDSIEIIPAIMNLAVTQTFWVSENEAKIIFTIDKWNNLVWDVTLTKLSIWDIYEIRDNNDNIFTQGDVINSWDVFTLVTWTGSIGSNIELDKSKVWFTIDWVEYSTNLETNLNLWTYTE